MCTSFHVRAPCRVPSGVAVQRQHRSGVQAGCCAATASATQLQRRCLAGLPPIPAPLPAAANSFKQLAMLVVARHMQVGAAYGMLVGHCVDFWIVRPTCTDSPCSLWPAPWIAVPA